MPVTYQCEECQQSSDKLDGWLVVSVNFMHIDATLPAGGRMMDSTAPELLFDKAECRDAWCERAGLVAIVQPK